MTARPMTHGDLVNSILLTLSPHGLAWSNPTGALKVEDRFIRYGLSGSSDVLACIKGRFVGVEAKVGRDTHRANQRRFADAVHSAGGIYILARSVDDVTNRLRLEGLL